MTWVDVVAETKSICSPSYCCWLCNLSAGETPNIIWHWAPNVMLSLKETNKPLSGKLFTLDTLCHGEGSDMSWLGFTCISRYGYSFLPAVPQLFCYPRAHRVSDLSTWDRSLVVILNWEENELETKITNRDKGGYYTMIKWNIHQLKLIIMSTCASKKP